MVFEQIGYSRAVLCDRCESPISECAHCSADIYVLNHSVGDYPVCDRCNALLNSIQTKLEFLAAVMSPANGELFEFLNEWSWDVDSPVPGLVDDYIKWSDYDFERWAVFGELKKVVAYG